MCHTLAQLLTPSWLVQLLIENHMLTSNQEHKLIETIKIRPELHWLQLLYRSPPPLSHPPT